MVYHGFPMFTSTIQWMDKLFPPTPFAEADWYDMPHDVLARISNRIINEAVFDASGHWVCSEVLMDIDGRWKKKSNSCSFIIQNYYIHSYHGCYLFSTMIL
jgi:hypothetical protein